MNEEIIIRRDRYDSAIMVLVSALAVGVTALVAHAGNHAVALLELIGLPALFSTTRALVANQPHLRANYQGLWFGGGRVVPWRDVEMIGVRPCDVAIYFRSRKSLLRLPPAKVVRSMFSVGDVDVSCGTLSAATLAAQIDNMRSRYVGSIDGVTVDAARLPVARVVSKDE